jgi:acetyl/propionyl-CoA carboxylase alpha subunit
MNRSPQFLKTREFSDHAGGRFKIAAAAICVWATTQVVAEDTNSSPHATFSIAGIKENQEFHADTAQSQDVLASQARYRTDKAELDAALDECSKTPAQCPAPLKAFAKMIGNLKKNSRTTRSCELSSPMHGSTAPSYMTMRKPGAPSAKPF